ncbi:hypothetical protein F511_07302 [Dorcoceras hygrometricum]|uniref:Uncharacterized protein n=1 Tax=Dorcoceras hygrometricum TaxID=472368 RepID=A0A2Z7CXP3_9LAMI|nr:hypothetical protein F511_07302 [Dorcoceras hygrometricum]
MPRRAPPAATKSRGGNRTTSRQARRTAARNVARPAGEHRPVVAPASGATVRKTAACIGHHQWFVQPTSQRAANSARIHHAAVIGRSHNLCAKPAANFGQPFRVQRAGRGAAAFFQKSHLIQSEIRDIRYNMAAIVLIRSEPWL